MSEKTAIESIALVLSKAHTYFINTDKDYNTVYLGMADYFIQEGLTIAALDAEKPAEDVESCLSKMFRDIREIGYITEPLRLTNESHDACVYILAKFAESYHAERCKECKALPRAE